MKRYLLLFITITSLASCKKDEKPYPYQYNPVTDYLPMTSGTTWEYGISGGDTPNTYTDSIKVTMTTGQSAINGKTYTIGATTSADFVGIGDYYFYKDNATYKTYYTVLTDNNTGDKFDVPFLMTGKLFNRDTTYYIIGNGNANAPEWRIETYTSQVPQDVTLGKTTYKNCIGSEVTFDKLYDGTDPAYIGQYQVSDDYQFDFAPNVGMIQEIYGWNDMLVTLLHSDIKQ